MGAFQLLQTRRRRILLLVGFISVLLVAVSTVAMSIVGSRKATITAHAQQSPAAAPKPDFSNKALHWQTHVYVSNPGSRDPRNGAWSISDIWVKIGSNNQPLLERGVTTLNGQFQQAVIYDYTNWTLTFIGMRLAPSGTSAGAPAQPGAPAPSTTPLRPAGVPIPSAPPGRILTPTVTPPRPAPLATPAPSTPLPCVATQPITSSNRTKIASNALPPYLDLNVLQADGYQTSTQQLPPLPALDATLKPTGANASPVSTLKPSSIVVRAAPAITSSPPDGGSTSIVGVDSSTGQEVAWESSQAGGAASSLRYAVLFSPIEVYAGGDISNSLFAASSLQGECNGRA